MVDFSGAFFYSEPISARRFLFLEVLCLTS